MTGSAIYSEAVESGFRVIENAQPDKRERAFANAALDIFRYGRAAGIDPCDIIDRLNEVGIVFDWPPDDRQRRIAEAIAKSSDTPTANGHPVKNGEAKPQGWSARRTTAAELQKMTFQPIKYVLPGYITEGLTLLVARPKMGKSWLCMDLAIAVSAGRFTLGDLKPEQGNVLYLALEDSRRRLQRRMDKLLGPLSAEWPKQLELHTEWRKVDEGGLDDLEEWCESVPNPVLIIIDTLERIRPMASNKKNERPYAIDYAAGAGLARLAGNRGLAVVVVHHDRKNAEGDAFDSISGTLGLNASADTMLVMKKQSGVVTLHCTGRDVEASETALQFDKNSCRWTILGAAAEVRQSGERSRIIAAIRAAGGPLHVKDLQKAAGHRNRGPTDTLLSRMVRDGELERPAAGFYNLPEMASETGKIDRPEA